MGRLLIILFVLFLNASGLVLLGAESRDPSDLFLSAYLDVQAAEKFEADENYKMALAKYRHAYGLLDRLTKDFPDWQPLIVSYRTKKTEESISKLQQKAGALSPPRMPPSGLPESEAPPLPEKGPPEETPSNMEEPATAGDAVEAVKRRIKHLEQDLEAEHERADEVEKRNEEITSQLQLALKERDSTKVQAVEEKSRIRELEEALKSALQDTSKDFTGKKNMEEEIQHLNQDLVKARDERDEAKQGAQDESDRSAGIRKRMQALQQERDAAAQKNQELEGKLADAQKQVETLSKQGGKPSAEMTAKLAAATKEAADLKVERDTAVAARDALTEKLNTAQSELASVKRERDNFRTQRDQALADLTKLKEAQKQVVKLMSDNASLTARLSDAEKAVAQFKADAPKKDEQIATLTKQIADVRDQLAASQKQNRDFQGTMAELQDQLDKTSSELERVKAEGASPEEKKRITDENKVLRDIVYRSLKEEARREQARTIVMGEMSRLEGQSATLLDKLKYLAEPVVKLSPKESAMFKQPEVAPAAENNEGMNIEISAPKNELPLPVPGPSPHESETTNPLPSPGIMNLAMGSTPPLMPAAPAPTPTPAPQVETAAAPNVPDAVRPLVREAKDFYDRGKFHEAERSYERSLLRAPNNVFILSNLGVVRFKLGKLKGSEEAFKKAIAIAPNDTFSRTTLGIVYYQQARYDDAIDQLTKALSINPKIPQAHNYLGITASMKGWPEATEKELLTAIALDDKYADANFNLAVVYATRQPPDKEKAKRYYKRAVELGSEPDPSMEQLLK